MPVSGLSLFGKPVIKRAVTIPPLSPVISDSRRNRARQLPQAVLVEPLDCAASAAGQPVLPAPLSPSGPGNLPPKQSPQCPSDPPGLTVGVTEPDGPGGTVEVASVEQVQCSSREDWRPMSDGTRTAESQDNLGVAHPDVSPVGGFGAPHVRTSDGATYTVQADTQTGRAWGKATDTVQADIRTGRAWDEATDAVPADIQTGRAWDEATDTVQADIQTGRGSPLDPPLKALTSDEISALLGDALVPSRTDSAMHDTLQYPHEVTLAVRTHGDDREGPALSPTAVVVHQSGATREEKAEGTGELHTEAQSHKYTSEETTSLISVSTPASPEPWTGTMTFLEDTEHSQRTNERPSGDHQFVCEETTSLIAVIPQTLTQPTAQESQEEKHSNEECSRPPISLLGEVVSTKPSEENKSQVATDSVPEIPNIGKRYTSGENSSSISLDSSDELFDSASEEIDSETQTDTHCVPKPGPDAPQKASDILHEIAERESPEKGVPATGTARGTRSDKFVCEETTSLIAVVPSAAVGEPNYETCITQAVPDISDQTSDCTNKEHHTTSQSVPIQTVMERIVSPESRGEPEGLMVVPKGRPSKLQDCSVSVSKSEGDSLETGGQLVREKTEESSEQETFKTDSTIRFGKTDHVARDTEEAYASSEATAPILNEPKQDLREPIAVLSEKQVESSFFRNQEELKADQTSSPRVPREIQNTEQVHTSCVSREATAPTLNETKQDLREPIAVAPEKQVESSFVKTQEKLKVDTMGSPLVPGETQHTEKVHTSCVSREATAPTLNEPTQDLREPIAVAPEKQVESSFVKTQEKLKVDTMGSPLVPGETQNTEKVHTSCVSREATAPTLNEAKQDLREPIAVAPEKQVESSFVKTQEKLKVDTMGSPLVPRETQNTEKVHTSCVSREATAPTLNEAKQDLREPIAVAPEKQVESSFVKTQEKLKVDTMGSPLVPGETQNTAKVHTSCVSREATAPTLNEAKQDLREPIAVAPEKQVESSFVKTQEKLKVDTSSSPLVPREIQNTAKVHTSCVSREATAPSLNEPKQDLREPIAVPPEKQERGSFVRRQEELKAGPTSSPLVPKETDHSIKDTEKVPASYVSKEATDTALNDPKQVSREALSTPPEKQAEYLFSDKGVASAPHGTKKTPEDISSGKKPISVLKNTPENRSTYSEDRTKLGDQQRPFSAQPGPPHHVPVSSEGRPDTQKIDPPVSVSKVARILQKDSGKACGASVSKPQTTKVEESKLTQKSTLKTPAENTDGSSIKPSQYPRVAGSKRNTEVDWSKFTKKTPDHKEYVHGSNKDGFARKSPLYSQYPRKDQETPQGLQHGAGRRDDPRGLIQGQREPPGPKGGVRSPGYQASLSGIAGEKTAPTNPKHSNSRPSWTPDKVKDSQYGALDLKSGKMKSSQERSAHVSDEYDPEKTPPILRVRKFDAKTALMALKAMPDPPDSPKAERAKKPRPKSGDASDLRFLREERTQKKDRPRSEAIYEGVVAANKERGPVSRSFSTFEKNFRRESDGGSEDRRTATLPRKQQSAAPMGKRPVSWGGQDFGMDYGDRNKPAASDPSLPNVASLRDRFQSPSTESIRSGSSSRESSVSSLRDRFMSPPPEEPMKSRTRVRVLSPPPARDSRESSATSSIRERFLSPTKEPPPKQPVAAPIRESSKIANIRNRFMSPPPPKEERLPSKSKTASIRARLFSPPREPGPSTATKLRERFFSPNRESQTSAANTASRGRDLPDVVSDEKSPGRTAGCLAQWLLGRSYPSMHPTLARPFSRALALNIGKDWLSVTIFAVSCPPS